MSGLTIFFGDVTENLGTQAKAFDSNAVFVNYDNYKDFINDTTIVSKTIYTSLGDLPKNLEAVYQLLDQADQIYYIDEEKWSDHQILDLYDVPRSMQGLSEYILFYFYSQKNNVHGLNLEKYLRPNYTALVDTRKTQDKQLWISGCSIADGKGVDPEQRYGHIIGQELHLPVSFLTCGGASLEWAADQILRSDIREDDIVILGLTGEHRFPLWCTEQKVRHVHPLYKQFHHERFLPLPTKTIDLLLTDDTRFYQYHIHIEQIVNFCRKIKAKLILLGLIVSESTRISLYNTKEFIDYRNLSNISGFVDLGTDNVHPGPLQHKLYAEFCLDHLKKST